MATGFFTHNRCLSEDEGSTSLDRPERIEQIHTLMQASALARRVQVYEAKTASEADILRVHSPEYIQKLRDLAQKGAALTAETLVTPELLEGAFLSAGAAVEAVRAVLDGSLKNAFVCVRPPGQPRVPSVRQRKFSGAVVWHSSMLMRIEPTEVRIFLPVTHRFCFWIVFRQRPSRMG